jgi:flavin-dependent dehydrogenase
MKTDIILRNIFDINLRMVKRKDLDTYLITKYISIGGRVFEKEIISAIDNEEKIVVTQNLQIKYKTLIGADGALSQVRKIITGKA